MRSYSHYTRDVSSRKLRGSRPAYSRLGLASLITTQTHGRTPRLLGRCRMRAPGADGCEGAAGRNQLTVTLTSKISSTVPSMTGIITVHYACATHHTPGLVSLLVIQISLSLAYPPKAAGKRNLRLAACQPQPERPDGGYHSQACHQSACIYAMPIKWIWSSLSGLNSPLILPKQEEEALPSSCLPCLPAKKSITTSVAKKKDTISNFIAICNPERNSNTRYLCTMRPGDVTAAQACPGFGYSTGWR
ncbi:hypothetical protein V8F20_005951 [Naviculisporaceae sp. PSN 640]